MDDTSIFPDKAVLPSDKELIERLASTSTFWVQIQEYVFERYPDGLAEWNFAGKKYGWSFRIKDKRRAIIYFLPRDNYFKVAFVFGQKATDVVLNSDIAEEIKKDLAQATKYAEGRGIRIDVNDDSIVNSIEKLIDIKLEN